MDANTKAIMFDVCSCCLFEQVNLTIREDKIKGIYVAGVTEEYVTSHTELLDIMSIGERASHTN